MDEPIDFERIIAENFDLPGDFWTPETAALLIDMVPVDETRARIDELTAKLAKGPLSENEQAKWENLQRCIEITEALKAKARAVLATAQRLRKLRSGLQRPCN